MHRARARNRGWLVAAAALAVLVSTPSLAGKGRPAPKPAGVSDRDATPYAGDCGPNPPPGYRHDLKDWRTGFNRDFSCYMLDEN